MRISDWSSDVCSSDLAAQHRLAVLVLHPLEVDFHLVADLQLRHLAGLGEFLQGHAAFRLQANVDQRAVAFDRDDGAAQHLAFEGIRSEEHTSELQSLMRISYAVFCLKKKTKRHTKTHKK